MNCFLLMLCLLILSLFFNFAHSANPPYGALSVSGTKLKGSGGQDVALHGMSLFWSQLSEGAPFYNAETVKAIKCQWNSNVVRAAMGVEDGGYLSNPSAEMAKVEAVIKAAIDQGIYVIVDWHDHHATDHTQQAIQFFTKIAQTYGSYPHIIYETFNEPLQVSWDSVKNYHKQVVDAIRKVDPDNVIILGTTTWSQDVDVAANSPLTGYKNIMYTLHYYAATHKQDLRNKVTTAINKGLPIFVTEYGTVTADGNGYVDAAESKTWWSFLDGLKISYVDWAMDAKNEKSAALTPGSSSANVGDSSHWTESGKLVNAQYKSQNNGVSCSGSSGGGGGGSATTTTTTKKPSGTTTTTRAPSGGGGGSASVSVSLQVGSTWTGGREYKLVFKNNGSKNVCYVRFRLQLNGGSIDGKWNFDSVGSDQYVLPSWVNIVPGAEFKDAGLAYRGNGSPSASVLEARNC